MFSETLEPKGGVILTPANSKTKDTTTTKLFTVIVRHISTKNQQLDFPNFHCSIVCSYCSIVCLNIKLYSWPKNIIFWTNFGGGTAGKFREMAKNRETYCHAN